MPESPSIEIWNQLLHHYVNQQGRVNYRAWKIESLPLLTQWLDQMGQFNFQHLADPDTQLALWLNLYNALTIAQVLQQYPIASIRPQFLGLPNWLGLLYFFQRPIWSSGDRSYSLNQIEHGILRHQFNEPRIHFALVCASLGCPLLRPEAYRGEIVRKQLEADADRFIHNSDKVRYEPQHKTLYCSKIFKWYRQDFLKFAPSLPDYINLYRPDLPIDAATRIQYLPYSWNLNQQ